jgi:long-chain fatty acid transport protein
MTRVKGRNLSAGAGMAIGDVKFKASLSTPFPGGDGGQQSGLAPILSGFYTHQLNDRWTAGAGLYSITGSAIDPDDAWVERF